MALTEVVCDCSALFIRPALLQEIIRQVEDEFGLELNA